MQRDTISKHISLESSLVQLYRSILHASITRFQTLTLPLSPCSRSVLLSVSRTETKKRSSKETSTTGYRIFDFRTIFIHRFKITISILTKRGVLFQLQGRKHLFKSTVKKKRRRKRGPK
ncbi:hypothetical protein L6452_33048 [Arctium lappa]|uniref:Uncharacterized protein n=1 Tax=Arctium lappa TaxID=4217 RepID=A0ACB8Z5E0_ARCLA|nr:hypothetical protein L6452_33048 [Arctium lappa]